MQCNKEHSLTAVDFTTAFGWGMLLGEIDE
jgi:hypothetical protein